MGEIAVERDCRDIAKACGGLLIKLSPIAGLAGIPDRLLLWPSAVVVFVEFKAPRRYARPRQRYWHKFLRGLGFRVEIVRTVSEFTRLLDTLPKIHQTSSYQLNGGSRGQETSDRRDA